MGGGADRVGQSTSEGALLKGTGVGGELGPLLLWICLVTIAVIYIAGALGLALGLTEGRWRRGGSARESV